MNPELNRTIAALLIAVNLTACSPGEHSPTPEEAGGCPPSWREAPLNEQVVLRNTYPEMGFKLVGFELVGTEQGQGQGQGQEEAIIMVWPDVNKEGENITRRIPHGEVQPMLLGYILGVLAWGPEGELVFCWQLNPKYQEN
jgi:hypothetical protein